MAAYLTAAHFVMRIALVPSFMESLDEMFSRFTEKGYSEQVYTEDIVNVMEENKSELALWMEIVDAKKYYVISDDEYKLIGVVFSQPEEAYSGKWVMLLHGYTGWKEELYTVGMNFFKEGYNVLAVDMRCHGESEGDFIGMGYTDRLDNLIWINAILAQDPDAEIVLYGQSMGACAAIHLSAEISENYSEIKAHIKAAIVDSAFCDPVKMFKSKVKDWTGLPCFGLLDVGSYILKFEGGYDLKDAKAIDAIGKSQVPTLFIQGLDDKIVNPDDVYELFDACNTHKDILTVEGAGHCQSCEKIPTEYYDAVFSFIKMW